MTNEEILKKAIEKYMVGTDGRIINRKSGKRLNPGTYNNGYRYICVYMGNGITKKVKIHRLVATVYIPNPNNKPHINHKDSNPSNNHVENLEWCTPKENVIHGFQSGRQQWNKGKLSKSQIYRLCKRTPRRMFWVLTTNNFQLAKAFWGEDVVTFDVDFFDGIGHLYVPEEDGYTMWKLPRWQYHLQQMVLEENPIKYLEKFLE